MSNPNPNTPENQVAVVVNIRAATDFLVFLDDKATRFTFQTMDDNKERRTRSFKEHKRDIRGRTLVGTFEEHKKALIEANRDGCAVYVTINETKGLRRRAEDVTRVRKHFVELDRAATMASILSWSFAPAFIVESSPAKHHVYFNIAADVQTDLAGFRGRQAKLAAMFGGDPKCVDLPRVLRLPGFYHCKGKPFQVRCVHDALLTGDTAPAYTVKDFERTLGQITNETAAQSQDFLVEPDMESEIAWFRHHLDNDALPSIEGEGGNDHALAIAALGKDHGLTDTTTCDVMLHSEWNKKCQPPFEPDELEILVRNAYEYLTEEAPGSKTAEADFAGDPVDEEQITAEIAALSPPTKTSKPPVFTQPKSAAELDDTKLEPDRDLVEGLILQGWPQPFDGDGGVGKSLLMAQLSVHVAAGKPFFGHAVEQTPVVFITHEDNEFQTRKRMLATAAYLGVDFRTLPMKILCDPSGEFLLATIDDNGAWKPGPYHAELDRICAANEGAFLALDCVTDFFDFNAFLRPPANTLYKKVLAGFVARHGVTPFLLRHPSKTAMATGAWYEGSTGNISAVRNGLYMKLLNKDDPDGPRLFGKLKANYGPHGKLTKIVYDPEHGIFVRPDEATLTKERQAVQADIIAFIVDMMERGLVVVKHEQASGHGPKAVAQAMQNANPSEPTPTKEEVLAAMQAAEHAGTLVYCQANNNKHIKAHFELGAMLGNETT